MVPFGGFPDVVIHMISRCLKGPVRSNFDGKPDVSYTAHLNLETGVFMVEENMYFSTAVLMRWHLTRGDDQVIKDYLSSRLELAMRISASRAIHISGLNQEMEELKQEQAQTSFELTEFRLNSNS